MNTDGSSGNSDLIIDLDLAAAEDAEVIAELINDAYRGTSGWTTEANFVAGNRIETPELEKLVSGKSLYTAKIEDGIVGCFNIEPKDKTAILSLLVCKADIQNQNLGKRLIDAAKQIATTKFQATELIIWVVAQRIELIEYYERRGFKKVNDTLPYPTGTGTGIPKQNDLTIQQLSMNI